MTPPSDPLSLHPYFPLFFISTFNFYIPAVLRYLPASSSFLGLSWEMGTGLPSFSSPFSSPAESAVSLLLAPLHFPAHLGVLFTHHEILFRKQKIQRRTLAFTVCLTAVCEVEELSTHKCFPTAFSQ